MRPFARRASDLDYDVLRERYRKGGNTLTGTTTANKLYNIGNQLTIPIGSYARYATLIVVSGGSIYFGRSDSLGNQLLPVNGSYTFDYVDISGIVLKDNGTATSFMIDYTGP